MGGTNSLIKAILSEERISTYRKFDPIRKSV